MNLLPPTCPQCHSPDLRHEGQDRYQCSACLWRSRIGIDGVARSLVDLGTAGRRRPKTAKVPPTDLSFLEPENWDRAPITPETGIPATEVPYGKSHNGSAVAETDVHLCPPVESTRSETGITASGINQPEGRKGDA